MDVHKPELRQQRRRRRLVWSVGMGLLVLGVLVAVSQLEPALLAVSRSEVFIGLVTRGDMTVDIRGLGVLAPEQVVLIPARDEGRIERRPLQPGVAVSPDTVLFELSNPELEQEAFDVEAEIRAAEAEYADLEVRLEKERLDLAAAVARAQGLLEQAKAQLGADRQLADAGLLDAITLRKSEVAVRQLTRQMEIEQARLDIQDQAVRAQLAAKGARIDQQRRLLELRKGKLARLRILAGVSGVLQKLEAEVGQLVQPGDILARISDPTQLKAALRIPETQARDILLGLPAEIDTRNGVIPGAVVRIDPAVEEGTVTVDVRLDGLLPAGARPDLSVDGRIILRQLDDVVKVQRPIHAQSGATLSLFVLNADGASARREQVRIGATSVREVQIVEGLEPGAQVILSDPPGVEDENEIRLE